MSKRVALIAACLLLGAAGSQRGPFNVLGAPMTILVPAAQTNGASVTIQFEIPPGGGPPAHVHTREDETFVILKGDFRFWHGTQVADGKPGTVVFMPRNEAHQFRNVGATTGTIVVTVMPAGLEQMFIAMSDRGLSAPKDLPEIVSLGKQYGVTYVAPLAPPVATNDRP